MERFELNLAEPPDDYSLKQLQALLKLSGATMTLHNTPTLSDLDIGYRLEICYDKLLLKKAETRNAGRKMLDSDITISVAELERMITKQGAKQAASYLGMSRATMYRRLKQARENGYTLIW